MFSLFFFTFQGLLLLLQLVIKKVDSESHSQGGWKQLSVGI